MKRSGITILIIFLFFDSYGQRNTKLNIDTLLLNLTVEKTDSGRVDILRNISEYYRNQNPDTSLVVAQQALDLARKIKYDEGEISALFTMGKIFVSTGNYPKALELYLQSLTISERNNYSLWICINSNYIGELYGYQSDYTHSLEYFMKAVSIAEKKQYNSTLATAYYNISRIYENKNQLDSAKSYGLKSYEILKLGQDLYMIAKILNTLGSVSFKLGEKVNALEYYRKGIPYAKDVEDNVSLSIANLGIANIFQSGGQLDSCLFYAKNSLFIAQQAGFMKQVMEAGSFLSEYYKRRGLFDSSLSYKEIYITAKDSIISQDKITGFQRISFEDQLKRKEIEQDRIKYRNSLKTSILFAGLVGLLLLAFVLWRNIRIKQKANLLLSAQKLEIDGQKAKVEASYKELTVTQAQLIQSEKMASLGELTAGIAHEIQNPLNFVNNFSEVNTELIDEMMEQWAEGNKQQATEIAEDIKRNNEKINYHGKRADSIVKGMLQHSRNSSGLKEPTDINNLVDECMRLSYHGLRAKDKSFNAKTETNFDSSISKINIAPQEIGRVMLNLFTNAFYSVMQKRKDGSAESAGKSYSPQVSASTKREGNKLIITVSDNGNGIPQKVIDKIFQPFFTTKPTGEGTGLGLSMSYDIITKGHGGELKVDTREGEFARFTIILPV